VNTRLHSIFVKYNTKITTSALQNQVPDYEDALDLAIIEQVWCSQNYPLTLTPFSEVTARLFYNLDLATSATDALKTALQKACPSHHANLLAQPQVAPRRLLPPAQDRPRLPSIG
jgi:hypothetical protein